MERRLRGKHRLELVGLEISFYFWLGQSGRYEFLYNPLTLLPSVSVYFLPPYFHIYNCFILLNSSFKKITIFIFRV